MSKINIYSNRNNTNPFNNIIEKEIEKNYLTDEETISMREVIAKINLHFNINNIKKVPPAPKNTTEGRTI